MKTINQYLDSLMEKYTIDEINKNQAVQKLYDCLMTKKFEFGGKQVVELKKESLNLLK